MAWLWPSGRQASGTTSTTAVTTQPLLPPAPQQPVVNQKRHQCDQCQKSYSRPSGLQAHRKIIHGGRRAYLCHLCSRTFTIHSSLVRHMRLHSGDRPYSCHMCGKGFITKTHLDRHKKSHTGEKPFRCKLCSKRYKTSTDLKYHIRTHSADAATRRPFCCPICEKSYTRKTHLTDHMKIHAANPPYKCTLCPKEFATSVHLNYHRCSHSEVRPYKCRNCLRAFKKSSALKDHMRQHTGDTPYKCPICYQGFRRNTTLKMHLKQHKNDPNFNAPSSKMYHCNVCGQIFQFKQDFRTHRRTHVNEKLYQCIICAEELRKKTAFHSHWTSHSGLQHYECKICGKVLNEQGALVSHRRQHPDSTPYQCAFCLLAFSNRDYFVCHLKTHISTFEDKIIKQFTEKGILEESLMRAISATSSPQGAFDEAVLSTLCDDDDKISQSMESFNPPPEFPAFSPGCYSPPPGAGSSGSLLNDAGGDEDVPDTQESSISNEPDFSAMKPSLGVNTTPTDYTQIPPNSPAECALFVPPAANQWSTQYPEQERCQDDVSKHSINEHLSHVFNTFADIPELSVSDIQGVYGSSLSRSSAQDIVSNSTVSLSSTSEGNANMCVGQDPETPVSHHPISHAFIGQGVRSSHTIDPSPSHLYYDQFQHQHSTQPSVPSYFHPQDGHSHFHLGVDRSMQPHDAQPMYHAYGNQEINSHGNGVMAAHCSDQQQQLNSNSVTNLFISDDTRMSNPHLKLKDTVHSTEAQNAYFQNVSDMQTHNSSQHRGGFSYNIHDSSSPMNGTSSHHADFNMHSHFHQRVPNGTSNTHLMPTELPVITSNIHRELAKDTGITYTTRQVNNVKSDFSQAGVMSQNFPHPTLSSASMYIHESEPHPAYYPSLIEPPNNQTPDDLLQLAGPGLTLPKDYSEVTLGVESFPPDVNNKLLKGTDGVNDSLGRDDEVNQSLRQQVGVVSQQTEGEGDGGSGNSDDYLCELCNRSYQSRTGLQYHQRSAHAMEKPFKCEICNQSFSRNFSLKRHQLTHSGERQFACDICDKTFLTRDHLQRHKTSLHNDESYPCSKCDKVFSREEYLSRHMTEHTGEAPKNTYKCDICDKVFRDKYRYNDHKNSHSGAKPYVCHICSRDFSAHESLKRHVKIHGSEKPHICTICRKGFMRPVDLRKHMATHGSGEYRCATCSIPFSHEATLKKHMRTHEKHKNN